MSKISFYVEQGLFDLLDKLFKNKNRVIKHSVNHFFNTDCKLFFEPEGVLPYLFKDKNEIMLQGAIEYTFGIYPDEISPRKFLFLKEIEGNIIKTIIGSTSQLEFLSLVYLINQKLNLNYDAFENNRVDLIVQNNDQFNELAIDYAYSARLTYVFYEDFLKDYLTKSKFEKIGFLKQYIEQQVENT